MTTGFDYRSSGVDIELGDDASQVLYEAAKLTWKNRRGRLGEVVELALENPELQPYMKGLTPNQMQILEHPEKYTGLASYKAEEVAAVTEEMLKEAKLW